MAEETEEGGITEVTNDRKIEEEDARVGGGEFEDEGFLFAEVVDDENVEGEEEGGNFSNNGREPGEKAGNAGEEDGEHDVGERGEDNEVGDEGEERDAAEVVDEDRGADEAGGDAGDEH